MNLKIGGSMRQKITHILKFIWKKTLQYLQSYEPMINTGTILP